MYNVQVNERGQITIPKELRDKARLYFEANLKNELEEAGKHPRVTVLKTPVTARKRELAEYERIVKGGDSK